jgi:hypothetical protein
MAMFELNTSPTDRQLRQFGAICVAAVPLIIWMWGGSHSAIIAGLEIGAILGIIGAVQPRILKPLFTALILITLPIGLVVGEVILLAIFFGLFLPMAILFRILGRDALQRRTREEASSFWVPRTPPSSVRKYYHQS